VRTRRTWWPGSAPRAHRRPRSAGVRVANFPRRKEVTREPHDGPRADVSSPEERHQNGQHGRHDEHRGDGDEHVDAIPADPEISRQASEPRQCPEPREHADKHEHETDRDQQRPISRTRLSSAPVAPHDRVISAVRPLLAIVDRESNRHITQPRSARQQGSIEAGVGPPLTGRLRGQGMPGITAGCWDGRPDGPDAA
jgi:hypothetical protein